MNTANIYYRAEVGSYVGKREVLVAASRDAGEQDVKRDVMSAAICHFGCPAEMLRVGKIKRTTARRLAEATAIKGCFSNWHPWAWVR